jgi:WhiB family transcriptional regulator, redox-sensing transcriptional regulator
MGNRPNNAARDVACIPILNLPSKDGWAGRAACAGTNPNIWFCEDRGATYTEARTICAACPVKVECLAWAVETNTQYGMWGGKAPWERKRLVRWAR